MVTRKKPVSKGSSPAMAACQHWQFAKQTGLKQKPKGIKEVFEMQTQKIGNSAGANLPEKKIRAGAVSATIWLNKGKTATGEETEYKTVAVERSYLDKEGKWQTTNSLRVNDLPKMAVVAQRAYEYLVLNEQDKRDINSAKGVY